MSFIILTFFAALLLEGLGSLVSVIGISALFGSNPIIILLAIALDVGKVVTISLLYTHWKELSRTMKAYAFIAAAVTMIITSAGAAGYLSGEFQKAIVGTKEGEIKVAVLKEQQAKYQERKKQIDDQIASLPQKTTVNQRLRLMNGFKAEQKLLDEKITQIDKDLPDMQIKQIGTEAKAGPIIAIAKAFEVPVEKAVSYVIAMIIVVFDPLAVFLIIAGNFLIARRKLRLLATPPPVKEVVPEPEETIVEPIEEIVPATPAQYTTYTTYAPTPEPVEEPIYDEEPPVEVVEEPETAAPAEVVDVPNEPRYVPTGLLKPINVDSPDDEFHIDSSTIIPMEVPQPSPVEAGPVADETKPLREQITRSSLGLVHEDPNTIVDAHRDVGFRKPMTLRK